MYTGDPFIKIYSQRIRNKTNKIHKKWGSQLKREQNSKENIAVNFTISTTKKKKRNEKENLKIYSCISRNNLFNL